MPLFQESIVKKYLSTIDEELIEKAFNEFKRVYSSDKIKNIRIAKEEQYQEGFIKDIFGQVLGYSVFPEQPFNIQTEKKNQADSKKADGAIFKEENVVGVIELKDNKTKNLDAVKDQAFGYKNNHKDCSYVISSNFHKLRFYVDDATDYEEFDLYNLDKEAFKRFYLYLRKEGLLDKNIPKLLRQETKFHEENITKSLYKDYSFFKKNFFQNVVKNNPQHDKLILFKKSQKFLDKVLFVLFAEDKGLVTTNSIVKIIEKWQDLKIDAFDTPKPLYQLISIFFNNLFLGKKDQNGTILIPEFGGEIFAPDEVLDTLIVDDAVLKDDLLKLSKYDFNTDVDVNILGHIFEHSLSEIEEVEAELKGKVPDKINGKRKKDGVFYTPKYITKYIIENTVGKICLEKKSELKLDVDIDILEHQRADGKLNAKGISFFEVLNQYKSWLLTLKILDPACGSGAFLNQVVNFLVEEHKFVDDLIAELTNTPLRLFDTDLAILENNIYGVDINEESIEIAKLSLWLRTAKHGRRLSNLSNNIKCGNSLIDDPTIAGDKSFNWRSEFPEVFVNGGFDIVIGNPPYVSLEKIPDNEKKFYRERYLQLERKYDTSVIFKLMSLSILRPNGILGFITTVTWQTGENYIKVRQYLLNNFDIVEIINLPFNVFADAFVDTGIVTIRNNKNFNSYKIYCFDKSILIHELGNIPFQIVENSTIDKLNWRIVLNTETQSLYNKIKRKENSITLGEISISTQGLSPSRFTLFPENTEDNGLYPYLIEGQVYRYLFLEEKIAYTNMTDKQSLTQFYDAIPKILFRRLINRQNRLIVSYTENKIVFKKDVNPFILTSRDFNTKYVLTILASKFMSYLYVNTSSIATKDDFRQTTLTELRNLPILKINFERQQPFIEKADLMLFLKRKIQLETRVFQRSIERKFTLIELPKKLQDWYLLSYREFINEFTKKKIKLSLSEEAEWEMYFDTEAKKILEIKAQIEKTDKEIDQMVYALYELTEEEVKIVEES